MTLSDLNLDFKVTGSYALNVVCAQLTRDLFAIAKFLFELRAICRKRLKVRSPFTIVGYLLSVSYMMLMCDLLAIAKFILNE